MQIKELVTVGNSALEGKEKTSATRRAEDRARESSGSSSQGDRVQLSERSREMAKAAETLASTPDIRQQKVAEIKERIQNQEYRVDADKVAHKMITDFLGELV